jgi:hypothetical protein
MLFHPPFRPGYISTKEGSNLVHSLVALYPGYPSVQPLSYRMSPAEMSLVTRPHGPRRYSIVQVLSCVASKGRLVLPRGRGSG